jgi:hypothetical protein
MLSASVIIVMIVTVGFSRRSLLHSVILQQRIYSAIYYFTFYAMSCSVPFMLHAHYRCLRSCLQVTALLVPTLLPPSCETVNLSVQIPVLATYMSQVLNFLAIHTAFETAKSGGIFLLSSFLRRFR